MINPLAGIPNGEAGAFHVDPLNLCAKESVSVAEGCRKRSNATCQLDLVVDCRLA